MKMDFIPESYIFIFLNKEFFFNDSGIYSQMSVLSSQNLWVPMMVFL